MLPTVVVGIDLGITEPEVGTQVDHHLAGLESGRGILGCDTMRQRQKNGTRITGGDLGGIRLGENQPRDLEPREPRHHLTERFTGMLA